MIRTKKFIWTTKFEIKISPQNINHQSIENITKLELLATSDSNIFYQLNENLQVEENLVHNDNF